VTTHNPSLAPARPLARGYAASPHCTGRAKPTHHEAALAIVGLPYVMSRASMPAMPAGCSCQSAPRPIFRHTRGKETNAHP
jgi:hypothetical protein